MNIVINKSISLGDWAERSEPLSFIVIHCSGYTQEVLFALWQKLKVSPHYFLPVSIHQATDKLQIDSSYQSYASALVKPPSNNINYPVYRLADENRIAKHAGLGDFNGKTSLNPCSIGIELHMPNYAHALEIVTAASKYLGETATAEEILFEIETYNNRYPKLDFNYYQNYSDEQIDALIILLRDILDRNPTLKSENIIGHSDYSAWRLDEKQQVYKAKTDPGPTFPWKRLAEAGLSIWPKEVRVNLYEFEKSIKNIQILLQKTGYALDITSELDIKTFFVMQAFIMHYLPERYLNLPHEFNDNAVQKTFEIMTTEKALIYLENLANKSYQYKLYESNSVHAPA